MSLVSCYLLYTSLLYVLTMAWSASLEGAEDGQAEAHIVGPFSFLCTYSDMFHSDLAVCGAECIYSKTGRQQIANWLGY